MTKRIAWITGASTGIGAAAAQKLAAEGWIVAVTARSAGKLDILCDKDPKFLKSYPGDITKPKEIAAVIDSIETELGPIQLALLNAGTYTPDTAEDFTAQNFKKHVEVNLIGTANCLEPILKRFLDRGAGHIALTASVAGYRGLPKSLSYGATKAALNNLAEALAIELHGTDIKVQVINPGFVKTPLTDQNDFDMPMIMEVDKAADKLVQGLKSSWFEITFPWMFCRLVKLTQALPYPAYFALAHKLKEKAQKKNKDSSPDEKKQIEDHSGENKDKPQKKAA
jgi:short-subunit dehydrogenase